MNVDPYTFLSEDQLFGMSVLASVGTGSGGGASKVDLINPWEEIDKLRKRWQKAEEEAKASADQDLVKKEAKAIIEQKEAMEAAGKAGEEVKKAKEADELAGTPATKKAVAEAEQKKIDAIQKYGQRFKDRARLTAARKKSEDPKKRKAADDAFHEYNDFTKAWLDLYERLTRNWGRWIVEPRAEWIRHKR